ncbi:MAG: hypothetical protein FWD63_04545, partial [Propionibacteriaceae bacterium]|nr:hypothetical protein [Propionibacteriaceae bacterium]
MSESLPVTAGGVTLDGSIQPEGGSSTLPPSVYSQPTMTQPRKKRHGIGWRTRLEIGVLSGPAVIVFVTFVIVPVIVAL